MAERIEAVEDMLTLAYSDVRHWREQVSKHNTKYNRNELYHANKAYNNIWRTLYYTGYVVVNQDDYKFKVVKGDSGYQF